jgi:hypothetical protein
MFIFLYYFLDKILSFILANNKKYDHDHDKGNKIKFGKINPFPN